MIAARWAAVTRALVPGLLAVSLLAGCGGGGTTSVATPPVIAGGTAPISTSTSNSGASTVALSLRFPANFHVARAANATKATKPAAARASQSTRRAQYVNPTAALTLTVYIDGISAMTGPTNTNVNGTQSLNVPVSVLGTSGLHTIEVRETDATSNVLADGTTSNVAINLGAVTSVTVTMSMAAAGIALMTQPVTGSDAVVLSSSVTNPALICSYYSAPIYMVGVDADNGFVALGSPPSLYPGVPLPTLVSQFSSGSSTLATSTYFASPSFFGAGVPISATWQVINPLVPGTPVLGYALIGTVGSSPCTPNGTFASTTTASTTLNAGTTDTLRIAGGSPPYGLTIDAGSDSNCSSSPTSGPGPFTITANVAGATCSITAADANGTGFGSPVTVSINIPAPPPVTASPASITFTGDGTVSGSISLSGGSGSYVAVMDASSAALAPYFGLTVAGSVLTITSGATAHTSIGTSATFTVDVNDALTPTTIGTTLTVTWSYP